MSRLLLKEYCKNYLSISIKAIHQEKPKYWLREQLDNIMKPVHLGLCNKYYYIVSNRRLFCEKCFYVNESAQYRLYRGAGRRWDLTYCYYIAIICNRCVRKTALARKRA
jgi:hypothetical protein